MDASTSTAANPKNSEYDVFLSHRGPDTKKGFASLLYHRLISFGLKVFLDQSVLERGGLIRPQIDSAIKSASVQVAILSPGYAESEWCLNELVSMFETGATIIPVFHKVEPSKVRWAKLEDKKTHGPEGEKPRYDLDTIEKWRKALQGVAAISGFELKECNDDEGELLNQVVECVLKNVKGTSLNVADHPTGLDDKVKDFERILLPKPQVVGIVGLGGVGKTTLVKEFFNLNRSSYSRSCFLSDIRENASTPTLISLQNKLLKDLTGSNQVIDNIDVGITTLKKHLSSNKALIILDDVDNVTQVNALWPVHTDLHSDSLILITSRNRDVLISSRVEGSLIYNLTGLDLKYSRKLFCLHSCRQADPPEGFESLVDKYSDACDGLPLSLKVFGALVYGKDKRYWTEQLDRLQQTLPSEIKDRLRISYDALEGEDKEIFLDIACFFTRYSRDTAIKIWEGSSWKGRLGLQNLQSRCLVTVGNENDLEMHAQIRDMGREVAESSFPYRIWRWPDQVIQTLLQQTVSENIDHCFKF